MLGKQNRICQKSHVKPFDYGRKRSRNCLKNELKLVLHCWPLHIKNLANLTMEDCFVWLKFKTSKQRVTICVMQSKRADKLLD